MTIVPKGRYAPERRAGKNVALLAPDVMKAFPTDESVNAGPAIGHASRENSEQEEDYYEEETFCNTAVGALVAVIISK